MAKKALMAALAVMMLTVVMLPVMPKTAYAAIRPPLPGTVTVHVTMPASPDWDWATETDGSYPGSGLEILSGYSGTDYRYGHADWEESYTPTDTGFADNQAIHCIDPGKSAPDYGGNGTFDLTYYRTVSWNGQDWAEYYGYGQMPPYQTYSPGQQNMSVYLRIPIENTGAIEIYKKSDDTSATDGNANYSIAGAQYGVYASSADAAADGGRIATLVTNGDGWAATYGLTYGTYYIKELVASQGYGLDPRTYSVDLGDSVATLNVLETPKTGSLALTKTSTNTSITNGNASYSLAGAVYGIYMSAADAAAGSNAVTTMTTDVSGKASAAGLPYGTYYVKETKAPTGYAKDTATHTVAVSGAAAMSVSDVPQSDPLTAIVRKVDADTGQPVAQGNASLAGAEFTVEYYDVQYSSAAAAKASGAPTRTWVIKTNANGATALLSAYMVSGDPLYYWTDGNPTIPIGTVVTYETKAPTGYSLPATVKYNVQNIKPDGSALEQVSDVVTADMPDSVQRGDLWLQKYLGPDQDDATNTLLPEAGIKFSVYGPGSYTGTTPKAGATPAFTLTTDAKGYADTTKLYVTQNADESWSSKARPAAADGGVPYGTYLFVQQNTTNGYSVVAPFVLTVGSSGALSGRAVMNEGIYVPIKVVKVDSETGKQVPYQASWQIIGKDGKPVTMMVPYPTVTHIDTFTSDEAGNLVLPEALPVGSYKLHEVSAPNNGLIGYLQNPADIAFSVTSADQARTWDDPLKVTAADAPAKGKITITKTDAGSRGGTVAMATYTVRAASDIVTLDGTVHAQKGDIVATVTTDSNGYAETGGLYLGTYIVQEAIAPEGYELDTTAHVVGLTYKDQVTPVVEQGLGLSDAPTSIHLLKVDASTGEPLPGATFALDFKPTVPEGGVATARPWSRLVTSDADGIIASEYLPHGDYTLTEVAWPDGYATPEYSVDFSVDDQGIVRGLDTGAEVTNTPITVELSKTDATAGEELPGASLTVTDSDGSMIDSWTSTDTPHVITKLQPGDYTLHEDLAPLGYASASDVAFTVKDTGTVQKVAMADEVITVAVSKKDATTGEELPGASLTVTDSDGSMIDSWTSTDTPHVITKLQPGDYTLHEDLAPLGYASASDVAFTVKDTGKIQKVAMKDEVITVAISKKDATTGEELPGAKLTLRDSKGKVVGKWTSTDTPHMITKLQPGDYTLHEDLAPLGYKKASDVKFTVEDTGKIQKVEMKDEVLPEGSPRFPYDKTGTDMLYWLLIPAAVFLLGGMGLGAYSISRRRRGLGGIQAEAGSEE